MARFDSEKGLGLQSTSERECHRRDLYSVAEITSKIANSLAMLKYPRRLGRMRFDLASYGSSAADSTWHDAQQN
jgi:hypothetical protein